MKKRHQTILTKCNLGEVFMRDQWHNLSPNVVISEASGGAPPFAIETGHYTQKAPNERRCAYHVASPQSKINCTLSLIALNMIY